MVKYCVQTSLAENKIQIDLSSLDPVSGRRVDVFNENVSKKVLMVQLKALNGIHFPVF